MGPGAAPAGVEGWLPQYTVPPLPQRSRGALLSSLPPRVLQGSASSSEQDTWSPPVIGSAQGCLLPPRETNPEGFSLTHPAPLGLDAMEWVKELNSLFRDIQDESEDGNEDRNEDLTEIAEEKITALYGANADQKTLEELKKDDKYAEIENLLSNSKIIISNSDVSEFASDVARFIQHSKTCPGGWYWPLVKSVKIKIPDCHELLEHIVIVDIPGTGDCNKTRDDLWKSKLRECSSVWIVSGINRATDDKDPWGILKHCIEELGPGGECKRINFICTKTDDISPDQKITCIRHRNEDAKTKMKEKFEKSEIKKRFRTENDFLQVFTVSSNAFFDTSLNLESAETEIPKLQDVLRSLNKSINRELTRDYVYEAKGVLSLIQSVQLDTDKKAAETKVAIRMDLENNLKKALSEMGKYFDSIYNDLEKCLSKGVDKSVQSCVASTKAMISPKKDGRGFHKTLQALCKNYGYYLPKNRDAVLDLNKRLVKPLHENIDEIFNQIFPMSGKTGKSVQEQIDKFTIIQSDPAYFRSSVERHIQNFIKIETMYAIVTLQDSDEVMVAASNWLSPDKKQCYWPPFKSTEKCTEAVQNRIKPETGGKPWEKLNIIFHRENVTFEKAKEGQKEIEDQKERSYLLATGFSGMMKRRRLENTQGMPNNQLTTVPPASRASTSRMSADDMGIMEKAKNIMKRVTDNLVHTIIKHNDIILKINKMHTVSRKKATIGIIGRTGEGKSSLLSAILGEKDLLPSGCFGACTSVVTQVEANLTDSDYTAEIELISKEEWEKELKDLFRDIQDESDDRNEDLIEIAEEKITALYGADADEKTLEELKKEDRYAEIENLLSISKKTISNSDVSEFASDIARFIQHSKSSPGDWYWPLVKSVNIKIPNCHELLEHIVIVDIPGTGDCNKTRDDLWKSKLRECSSVWIVSGINRASDDKDPWGILKHCIEELGPGGECKHINFICTKTDDINPVAYMRSARLTIPKDKDQKIMCIRHRNEDAKTKVKEKFEKSEIKKRFRTENDFLQVFTVSSNAFFDTSLNLESAETEIPKLQDVLKSLNKSINRGLTRDYVHEAKGVLSLIQSVQLDTDKKAAETKFTIRMDLENNLKKALSEMDKYFDSIYNDLEKCLSKGVEESVQSCVASTKALISKKDGRGFHKTLQALCKNYGCYLPKSRDKILDLNKSLVKPVHENIDDIFSQLFPVSGKTGQSVQEHIDKFTIIQSDFRSSAVRHIQNFIKTEEAKLKALLNRETVELKKDIYASIIKTILDEMSPCYEKAAALTGTGSMKERQDMLITTVDVKKQDMFNKAKMEVLKKLKHLKLSIKDALGSGLKKAMDLSLSQSSDNTLKDVSREIDQMEALLKQLTDAN
ncbi:hypothetical protein Q8A67_015773 [Cirrhinus molitorella]|uniref:Dynamin N-terminal domain-containing protein n=1 Tax=Cirrhinus molitorella TaxID=172907 RepID=A0AA88PU31_9TELE|nr:hypothetical protein Q8A67_015773 [Cirrhinus molitorella]